MSLTSSLMNNASLVKSDLSNLWLLCSQCLSNIPQIIKYEINAGKVYIKYKCICSPDNEINEEINQYLSKLSEPKTPSGKCSFHSFIPAKAYCSHCKCFMCQQCQEAHIKSSPLHLYSSDSLLFLSKCSRHMAQIASFHCNRCNIDMCSYCVKDKHSNHLIHSYQQYYNHITTTLPFTSMEGFTEYSDNINKNNQDYLKKTIEIINQKILTLGNYKLEIEQHYRRNVELNKQITMLIKGIYANFLSSQQFNSMNLLMNMNTNAQFNTFIFESTSSDIEETCKQLIEYYQHNFIILPFHLYKNKVFSLEGHTSGISVVMQLEDGKIASGSLDTTIKLWDLAKYTCVATLEGHKRSINDLIQLKNKLIASASSDDSIKLWDPLTYQCIETMKSHSGYVFSLIQLKDDHLLSSSYDHTIKLWSNVTYNLTKTIDLGVIPYVLIQLSNGLIAFGTDGLFIQLVDIYTEDKSKGKKFIGHKGSVRTIIQLKDDRLVSGSNDSTIKIWDVDRGICLQTINKHYQYVNTLLQLNDNRIVSGSFDDTIKFWSNMTFRELASLEGGKSVNTLEQLNDGRLISGSSDFVINIWY